MGGENVSKSDYVILECSLIRVATSLQLWSQQTNLQLPCIIDTHLIVVTRNYAEEISEAGLITEMDECLRRKICVGIVSSPKILGGCAISYLRDIEELK